MHYFKIKVKVSNIIRKIVSKIFTYKCLTFENFYVIPLPCDMPINVQLTNATYSKGVPYLAHLLDIYIICTQIAGDGNCLHISQPLRISWK